MLAWLISWTFDAGGKKWLSYWTIHSGQNLCVSWAPDSKNLHLYLALVCGVPLPDPQLKSLWIESGLIHLLVVSGSHLLFLQTLIRFAPKWIQNLALFAYCYLTGFQAPVTRAFVRRWMGGRTDRFLPLSGLALEALTVGLILLIWPPWLQSRSFQLSWMCALATSQIHWVGRGSLRSSLFIYLFLWPMLGGSPVHIFWNALLTPLVGGILFPLCLLSFLIHPLVSLTDALWNCLLLLLNEGPRAQSDPSQLSNTWMWVVPLMTHLTLILVEARWRKDSAWRA